MEWYISPYIFVIVSSWLVAHTTKFVIAKVKKQERRFVTQLFISGGMPSSHSAAVVSVALLIGLRDGVATGIFGLAALVAFIVMYDAVKVRRSSGEQGMALRQLITEQKSNIVLPRAAMGHTPIEVMIGALLGAVIAIVVFLATL